MLASLLAECSACHTAALLKCCGVQAILELWQCPRRVRERLSQQLPVGYAASPLLAESRRHSRIASRLRNKSPCRKVIFPNSPSCFSPGGIMRRSHPLDARCRPDNLRAGPRPPDGEARIGFSRLCREPQEFEHPVEAHSLSPAACKVHRVGARDTAAPPRPRGPFCLSVSRRVARPTDV